jgi:xanthine dehydrogenase YagT iron-sulfur-binding subunit
MRSPATIICPAEGTRRQGGMENEFDACTEPTTHRATAACSRTRTVRLRVNQRAVEHTVPVTMTLAELLRERLGLTGTKVACNQAACGACTVQIEGEAVFACHTLAVQADGADVRTIEGLSGNELDPLQQAFIDHDALQCGFCTPGMLMALSAALNAKRHLATAPTRGMLARAISGNICRCGAYEAILDAGLTVAKSIMTSSTAGPV